MTIPRSELCGALIVARLLKHMSGILHIPTENIYAWTDSEVMLGWLRGDPRRFKVFVGNRVSEILELTLPKAWRHVAGVASRRRQGQPSRLCHAGTISFPAS